MDRSLDSIGSCSLDVDADSSDISDTSGSLNFPTPLSIKDITREFTSNIHDRCALRTATIEQSIYNTTAYVHPTTGKVCMVLTEPSAGADAEADAETIKTSKSPRTVELDASACEKKPSYLNLACCVNGYSNLTTYDSKIRRDINKSREVSPIRPSTSSLQYCKKNNSLAAPVLLTMPNVSLNTVVPTPLTKQPAAESSKYTLIETNNNNNAMHHFENGDGSDHLNGAGNTKRGGNATSFIQQRVERLYGPGALAQGFYSPKKHQSSNRSTKHNLEVENHKYSTELARKFKQVSPSKDYSEFRKKLDSNSSNATTARQTNAESAAVCDAGVTNGDVDLPVFRHLSQEFRAQLPTVSPKRAVLRVSPIKELPATNGNTTFEVEDVVDHKMIKPVDRDLDGITKEQYQTTTKIILNGTAAEATLGECVQVKDGNYFLIILKNEQARLLALAAVAEKYIDALTNNPEISEDTFGLLRSAAGKARLLVSQKMKQFEGLCHNNLNRSPEDKFPTTIDDLQGFWDMVNLQVDHVDSIFADIEKLKSNEWKHVSEPVEVSIQPKSQKTIKTGNTTKQKSATSNVNSSKTDGGKSAAAIKREAQRKQILEMKRKHREAMTAANAVTVEADESNVPSPKTVGDASTSDIKIIAVDNSS